MENIGSKILLAGGILLVLLVTFIIVGVTLFSRVFLRQASAQEASTPATIASQPAANDPITINKIVTSPVVYKDIPIVVEGKIETWVTKRSVIVTEIGDKNGGRKLLVIRDQNFGLPTDIPASDVALGETLSVKISGRTGILNIVEGDTSFGDEAEMRELRNWQNRPVVFASSVVQK